MDRDEIKVRRGGTIARPFLGSMAWDTIRDALLGNHVPPLRGLVLRANTVPPLPRWATLFRPWRDWKQLNPSCRLTRTIPAHKINEGRDLGRSSDVTFSPTQRAQPADSFRHCPRVHRDGGTRLLAFNFT